MARNFIRTPLLSWIPLGVIYLFPIAIICKIQSSDDRDFLLEARTEGGALAGRMVQIPGKDYRLGFKAGTPKLGDCALKMGDAIQFCNEKFGGDEIFIPESSTVLDVSRVQSSEDILTHGMGAIGVSVGVLGLASVDVKAKVAVTTETSATSLNLMSSYEVKLGTLTLQNAHPETEVSPSGTLFLSEIQLGGNEMFLVTMDFESESKKTEVELTVKVKILFITITAKMQFIKETFKSASSVRVQFMSSWRTNIDKTFPSLDDYVIKEVEKIEETYLTGAEELKKMEKSDERLHNIYYFAAWNRGPYGENMNQAIINADLEILKQQNTEASSVLSKIGELWKKGMNLQKRTLLQQLNSTLAPIHEKLTEGLQTYHTISAEERSKLRDVYGINTAPLYYERKLREILNT